MVCICQAAHGMCDFELAKPTSNLKKAHKTLCPHEGTQLVAATLQLAHAALRAVDLCAHEASHPRLGVVDHVLCSPLGGAGVSHAAQAAAAIAAALAEGDPHVPVYLCAPTPHAPHTFPVVQVP